MVNSELGAKGSQPLGGKVKTMIFAIPRSPFGMSKNVKSPLEKFPYTDIINQLLKYVQQSQKDRITDIQEEISEKWKIIEGQEKNLRNLNAKKEKNIRKRREYKKWKIIQHKKRNRIYEMKENIRIEREYKN